MVIRRQALAALFLVMGLLVMGALACTSDEEWIIPRTETPTPSHTPPPQAEETLFSLGDRVEVVGTFQVWMTRDPEPEVGTNRVRTPCFANVTAEVLGVTVVDEVTYYQIDCGLGAEPGWVPESSLGPVE